MKKLHGQHNGRLNRMALQIEREFEWDGILMGIKEEPDDTPDRTKFAFA